MGTVVRARAADGRDVALKLMSQRLTPESTARFSRERRLLAALGEAEGFVALLDSGESARGPFFVMPYLAGGTLRERLARGPLGIEDGKALGVALARAMALAHEMGIVHRDLKPENVLFDAGGKPFIADLGLAKHFDAQAPGASQSVALSRQGDLRGTAGYMAPEQMRDAASVGPPADVFALGAILYECLAGRPAFAGETVLDLISKVEHGTHEPLVSLRSDVPRSLARVIERSLSGDPGARPRDAGELARTLEEGEARRLPVARFVVAAGLAVAATAALVLWKAAPEPGATDGTAPVRTGTAPGRPSPPDPFAPEADTPPVFMDRSELPPGYVNLLQMPRARLLDIVGEYSRHASAPIQQISLSGDGRLVLASDDSGQVKLWDVASGKKVRTLVSARAGIHGVAISPDARRAIIGFPDGAIRLLDLATGETIRTLGKHSATINTIAFSRDGKLAVSTSEDATLQVFDLESQASFALTGHGKGVTYAVFTPDGRRVLSSSSDNTLKLWDLAAARRHGDALIRTFTGHKQWVLACDVSPDGRSGASAGLDGHARIWDLETGAQILDFKDHASLVCSVRFTPDGRHVLTGCMDAAIQVWDLDTKEVKLLAGHQMTVSCLAATPDGRSALSGSWDESVRVWDLSSGQESRRLLERDRSVRGVSFLPGGKTFVTASDDGRARLLSLETRNQVRAFGGHGGAVLSVDTSGDGKRVVTGCEDGLVRVYDTAKEGPLFALAGHQGPVRAVAVSADGARAASAGEDGTVRIWDPVTGRQERVIDEAKGQLFSVALSANGARVAAGGADNVVRVWNATTGDLVGQLTGHKNAIRALSIDAEGERVLSGSDDRTVRSWTVLPRGHVAVPGIKSEVAAAVLFPDLRGFAVVLANGSLCFSPHDTEGPPERVDLRVKGLEDRPLSLAVSRDGTRVLVGTERGVVFHLQLGPADR
jgi:WD40 repeat protein